MSNSPPTPGLVVFSGGSAANNIVDVFDAVARNRDCPLSYVIPISDNGGSSSELLRVFGGPSVGDIRSRLVRLIPSEPADAERTAIKTLFNHRLSPFANDARLEWLAIVESRSPLWTGIGSAKRELIRSFLLHLQLEILKRARPPTNTFSFASAAVGNLFLTGARLFCGSLEAAVYLLSSITGVADGVQVLPAVNSNFTHHIAAGLSNGAVVVGQNAISHPGALTSCAESLRDGPDTPDDHSPDPEHEDANLPGSLPVLRGQNISFSKSEDAPLPARIERIWYINPYGQEQRPPANPRVLDALTSPPATAVVYSIGSLYTSLAPCLVLRGVGAALASPRIRHKILLLNGSLDRETGQGTRDPFSALDFVAAIAHAAHSSRGLSAPLATKADYSLYVSHVVYLDAHAAPAVDPTALKGLGIEPVRVYGRPERSGGRYDPTALRQALDAILGLRGEKGRRGTVGDEDEGRGGRRQGGQTRSVMHG
ncbi:MAG: hypothetical protein M1832_004253 [Thelocarpon impressellum]|nr:MAG: hypothetical protein M1832_004253 [Thelocarpon impressellum]